MDDKNTVKKLPVYHGSRFDFYTLKSKSFVTIYPHIAYIFAKYYTKTNTTWCDSDLDKKYYWTNTIVFKKDRIPDGVGHVYFGYVNVGDLNILYNSPMEFTIKKQIDVEKISLTQDDLEKSLMDYYLR